MSEARPDTTNQLPRRGVLRALSQEHHQALVLGRDCKRASDAEVAALRARIAAHHREVLVAHFAAEEALLRRHAAAVPAALQERTRADHAWLRARAQAMPPTAAAIAEYGQRLTDHVRFEERVLWPVLQRLPAADLAPAGSDPP
ncbi:hemerythrin domain-containing protein [Cognatiluteimonas weifangensis]|uniref:Hemerythrin domain-containing protein n=1 Tax=Cognatiluteimonas weifangensis TaxID=2303539 RepID=A0A372DPT5_9GAMM|nr:hemerythrin domain-containing protein [Luteimonas weifangensis]RFP61598.1 hemerythrin domain-containing protein [Luteimonas weifangensis]